jgi:hypothetical protein
MKNKKIIHVAEADMDRLLSNIESWFYQFNAIAKLLWILPFVSDFFCYGKPGLWILLGIECVLVVVMFTLIVMRAIIGKTHERWCEASAAVEENAPKAVLPAGENVEEEVFELDFYFEFKYCKRSGLMLKATRRYY